MLKMFATRLRQGHNTSRFPEVEPVMPERFRGRPELDTSRCAEGCHECAAECPTDAIQVNGEVTLDTGRCLFCTVCTEVCPKGAIRFTDDYRLAVRERDALVVGEARDYALAGAVSAEIQRVFGRSLAIRVVSAGGCNACEADINVLGTIVFDLSRFGIHYVASPRHADAMIVAGPVTENMYEAVLAVYDAIPPPKLVIAVGACAISGGPYAGHAETHDGLDGVVPVDLYIPGCPPHPYTILDGILRAIGRRG